MDQRVKRMLKLIEEDADSFSKKAEMYYQKRPELLALVEDFYRMYRALAERYDHVTGELRKSMPSDIQSQGSGISEISSDLPSPCPSPDQSLSRRKSGPRAAGFDFFLGSGGSILDSNNNKEGDETSTLDSESESDDSSVDSGHSNDPQGLRQKISELEIELGNVKEKLRTQEEENEEVSRSFRENRNGNSEDLFAKIAEYDGQLRLAKEKICLSEEEIARLKNELQKFEPLQITKDVNTLGSELEVEKEQTTELTGNIHVLEAELSDSESKVQALEKELEITKEKLKSSEIEVSNLKHDLENNISTVRGLQEQLGLTEKDVAVWKGKLDREKGEVSKLHDRIVRYKANLSDRDEEIGKLKEIISNANKSLSEENLTLQSEISKLLKERAHLEDNLKEWEFRCQCLEAEIKQVDAGKKEMEDLLRDEFKLEYDILKRESDELNARVFAFASEISSRDDQIVQMDKHLHQLHMEHVQLISGTEAAQKMVEILRSRVKELEIEVEKQRLRILEGAEEKREAIRQLCFSLEHYRNGYHRLREAFVGHKRLSIMAS